MIGAPPPPSWRKPAGMFVILGLILLWAIVIGSFSDLIGDLPWWGQMPVYVVSGVIWIWIMPLRSLLQWMETGRWRP